MVTTEPPDDQGNFEDRSWAFRIVLGLAQVLGATVSLYPLLATGLLVVLSKLLFRA